MFFNQDDPVAIHTLSMAGFRILSDLAEKCERSGVHAEFTSRIRPGKEKVFWGKFNSFANFLKHANEDPDTISDQVEEEINDSTLAIACIYYQDLGYKMTPEMVAMYGWYASTNPDVIDVENAPKQFMELLQTRHNLMKDLSRKEQLIIGKELIEMAKGLALY